MEDQEQQKQIPNNSYISTKTIDIYIDDDILRYTTEEKILGRTFNSRGITPHIKIRTAIAQSNLTKLYHFYNLNSKNKLELYNALVR